MLTGVRLQKKISPVAEKFRAAGDTSRLSILYMLAQGPMDLGTIIRRVRRSPSLISHHLNILRAAGWVNKSKFGKLVTYYLSEDAVKEVTAFLHKPKS